MPKVSKAEIIAYVKGNIQAFHSARLSSLKELKLAKIIRKKNPYLFKAKNLISGPELVKAFLDAHLSSQEESIFGSFLESLACFVCGQVHAGRKSSAEGVDLEFESKGVKYIVAIKSGPNWGNSSQIARMRDNFKKAKRILGTNTRKQQVVAVNGCCYGRASASDQGDYLKYCGQVFWQFISNDPEFYIDIIEPIGFEARERNEAFQEEYAKVITQFTEKFIGEFCDSGGRIVWSRIVEVNSGAKVTKNFDADEK